MAKYLTKKAKYLKNILNILFSTIANLAAKDAKNHREAQYQLFKHIYKWFISKPLCLFEKELRDHHFPDVFLGQAVPLICQRSFVGRKCDNWVTQPIALKVAKKFQNKNNVIGHGLHGPISAKKRQKFPKMPLYFFSPKNATYLKNI